MPPKRKMDSVEDLSSINVEIQQDSPSKKPMEAKVSSSWPALVEVEPARPAQGDRPFASPVYRPVFAKEGAPSLGHENLLDMFE